MRRRPAGYATIAAPDTPLIEYDTARCCHCGRVIFLKPGTASTVYLVLAWDTLRRLYRWLEEMGAWCARCDQPVCLSCHEIGTCTPFERWLDQQEGSRQAHRSLLLPVR